MEKQEFAQFAMALKTYFPREKDLLPNNQAMELWFRQLQDIPFGIAEASLNKWVATNKWSPSIADIREMAASVKHGDAPDWGEGWEQVLRAITRFGSYREGEALASMDELTRRCVERLGFRNICMSENISADRANFRDIYKTLAERQQKDRQISVPLKTLIAGIQEREALAAKETNCIEQKG